MQLYFGEAGHGDLTIMQDGRGGNWSEEKRRRGLPMEPFRTGLALRNDRVGGLRAAARTEYLVNVDVA